MIFALSHDHDNIKMLLMRWIDKMEHIKYYIMRLNFTLEKLLLHILLQSFNWNLNFFSFKWNMLTFFLFFFFVVLFYQSFSSIAGELRCVEN